MEFERAVQSFQASARRTVQTCEGIDAVTWVAQPPHRRHSISEVFEHVTLSIDLFRARLEKILASPEGAAAFSTYEDEEIPHLFERVDEPPGIAAPTGAWTDRDAALQKFGDAVAALVATAQSGSINMRTRGASHPIFGPMDGVQWALFAAAHTERHRSEIIGLSRLAPAVVLE